MHQFPESARELLFILPVYSQFAYARKCLESFVANTPRGIYCVAVIDDASPDWLEQSLQCWPAGPVIYEHYDGRDGLTRSWNYGLRLAKDHGFKYAICGNSDLLFTQGWYKPLKTALHSGFHLVGPVTNAPGGAVWQNVKNCYSFKLTDDRMYLDQVARCLRELRNKTAIECRHINGFCMMAKTKTWWTGAFDCEHVFDPKFKLTGNEMELQKRWRKLKRRIGYVRQSLVFHYRSVSRPEGLETSSGKGAFRNESLSTDATTCWQSTTTTSGEYSVTELPLPPP